MWLLWGFQFNLSTHKFSLSLSLSFSSSKWTLSPNETKRWKENMSFFKSFAANSSIFSPKEATMAMMQSSPYIVRIYTHSHVMYIRNFFFPSLSSETYKIVWCDQLFQLDCMSKTSSINCFFFIRTQKIQCCLFFGGLYLLPKFCRMLAMIWVSSIILLKSFFIYIRSRYFANWFWCLVSFDVVSVSHINCLIKYLRGDVACLLLYLCLFVFVMYFCRFCREELAHLLEVLQWKSLLS